jgi:hypothetical protein
MKLTPLEGELQIFSVACGRSYLTPRTATRSATVDMAVKWRNSIRESELNSHMEYFLWNFLRKPR